jgi:hypothetical protein
MEDTPGQHESYYLLIFTGQISVSRQTSNINPSNASARRGTIHLIYPGKLALDKWHTLKKCDIRHSLSQACS